MGRLLNPFRTLTRLGFASNARVNWQVLGCFILVLYVLFVWLLSYAFGLHADRTIGILVYEGYLTWGNYNWIGLGVLLPISWVLVCRHYSLLSGDAARVASLLTDSSGRASSRALQDVWVRQMCADRMRPTLVVVAIGAALILTAFDVSAIFHFYASPDTVDVSGEWDWTIMGVDPAHGVGRTANRMFVLVAYLQQAIITALGLWLLATTWAWNRAFVSRVFSRSRAARVRNQSMIVLNWRDVERTWGLGVLAPTFHRQISYLAVVGGFMLMSRLANVKPDQVSAMVSEIPDSVGELLNPFAWQDFALHWWQYVSLGDRGQWMLPIAWLLLLWVVTMPTRLKIIPLRGGLRGLSVRSFLVDFVRPHRQLDDDEFNSLAEGFRNSGFWPSRRYGASIALLLAIYVFLLILFPVRPWLDWRLWSWIQLCMLLASWLLAETFSKLSRIALGVLVGRALVE